MSYKVPYPPGIELAVTPGLRLQVPVASHSPMHCAVETLRCIPLKSPRSVATVAIGALDDVIEHDSCDFVFIGTVEEERVAVCDGDDLVDLVDDDSEKYDDVNNK